MAGTLLVASPGGHIDELYDFAPRLTGLGPRRTWVTARTPQTDRLLAAEPTVWVRPVASRQGVRALAQLPWALDFMRRQRPDVVISTGAALAVPYLVAARMFGVRTHYIESATRLHGPSVSGRMIERLPGIRLHHQGFEAPVAGWDRIGNVFDSYRPGPGTAQPLRRVLVILGTERYPFTRALIKVAHALPGEVEVLYQTGNTAVPDIPGIHRQWLPSDELMRAMAEVDVVVSHGGVGTVLTALRLGKHPVVMPRLAEFGEHVDDHQSDLARVLEGRGLISVALPDSDLLSMLTDAAQRTTVNTSACSIML